MGFSWRGKSLSEPREDAHHVAGKRSLLIIFLCLLLEPGGGREGGSGRALALSISIIERDVIKSYAARRLFARNGGTDQRPSN